MPAKRRKTKTKTVSRVRVKFDPTKVSPVPDPLGGIILSPKVNALNDALRLLELPSDWRPKTAIDKIVARLEKELPDDESIVSILAASSEPEAMEITKLMHNLEDRHLKVLTWDHLIAAAKIEPRRMLELIVGEVFSQWGAVTSVIAALKSPSLMKTRAAYGHMPDGHADAKMILQTTGVVPTPKNQVTNISVKAGQIGDRVLNIGGVRSLEDVVAECDNDLNVEADEEDLKSLPPASVSRGPVTIDEIESDLED